MEQILFVNWMRKNYKEHRIFHIGNGGLRNKAIALKMKNLGVSAGIPDLCIPSLRMYIEMKRSDGGVVSKEQKDWIAYLASVGYSVAVCHGFEESKMLIIELMQLNIKIIKK